MKKNKVKKITLSLALSFGLVTLNSFTNQAYAETTTNKEVKKITITGTILDAKLKQGLKDVYVKQLNTLNTVLTNDKGNFSITLEDSAEKKLLIIKEGYEKTQIDVSTNRDNITITLVPAIKFNSENLPAAHTDADDVFNYSSRPLASNFSAFYQGRYQMQKVPTFSNSSITSNGIALNEVAIHANIRLEDMMGSVKIFRSRYPVDVEKFEFHPVYNIDTTQFQLNGGKVFKMSEKADLFLGLSYLFQFNTPDNKAGGDNKPIPYTSSYMDFPQNRQGPGVTGIWGYNVSDSFVVNVNTALYPVIFTTFDSLVNPSIGYHGMLEAGINARMEIIPGVYGIASYNNQFFFSFGGLLDDSNFINLGISLDPFKMAKMAQAGLPTGK